MEVIFEIPGEPKGKGRPRFTVRGKFVQTYTDPATRAYEQIVAKCYEAEAKGFVFDENKPLAIEIRAYLKNPKKKIFPFPLKTPDCDNIAKIIMDGLNGVAYKDDKQIVNAYVQKRYADDTGDPSVWVVITDDFTPVSKTVIHRVTDNFIPDSETVIQCNSVTVQQ